MTDLSPEPRRAAPTLPEVAVMRGKQTLWQGLALDVLVAVALVVTTTTGPPTAGRRPHRIDRRT